MKRLFTGMISVLCGIAAAAPLAQYDFEGKTGDGKVTGKYSYEAGISGKGIALSDGVVRIPAPKGLLPDEGTVTLWVKPKNWDSSVNEFVFFLQNNNAAKDGRLILYKYKEPNGLGLVFWYGNPNGKAGVDSGYTRSLEKKVEKGKWTFLSISWSKKSNLIAVYHNGQMAASGRAKPGMFFKEFGDFLLNPPPFRPSNREYETVYDNLKFYSSALSEKELTEKYKEESVPALDIPMAMMQKTEFSLPKMKAAPRIDGNLVESEWETAAKLNGFIELSNPRLQTDLPGETYAGMDDTHFYFCFVAKIPGATQLVNRIKDRDGEVYMDDAFEIFMRPPEMKQGNYQTIVNYAGAIYDAKNSNKTWNGNWTVRNGLYEGQWICEMKIPIADFESSFAEGKKWDFNFCRDRQQEPKIIFSSVSPSAMPFSAYFGSFRMTSAGMYSRFSVDYAQLFERKLELKIEAFNLSGQTEKAVVKVEKLGIDGSAAPVVNYEREIKPGASAVITHTDPLSGFRSGVIRVTVADSKGTVIQKQDIPLVFRDDVKISTETNLSAAKLEFSADLKSHYALAKTVRTTVVLQHTATGKKLSCDVNDSKTAAGSFDLKQFPAGDCTLTFSFFDAAGKELMKVREPYKHIGIPRWLTEKPGLSDVIPYPYTPIERNGTSLNVLGRTHTFGKTLLPEQINSQGTPLFASAPVLKGKVDGNPVVFKDVKFEKIKDGDAETVMKFTASAGGLSLEGTVSLEYDGFFWYSMKLGKKPAVLEELFLEMEMPAAVAEYYNAHFFSRENYVGKLGDSLQLKRIPSIWLGNLDVGLTFVAETYQYWQNQDEKSVFRFNRKGGNVIWQIRFVDRKTDLAAKDLKFEFGIEANPVKPTPPQFRSWRVWFFDPFTVGHPWTIDSKIKKYPGTGGFFTPEHTSMEAFRQEVKRFRDRGAELSLYLNPFLVSPEATEYKIFRKEWRNPYNVYPLCPASSFTDYIAWQINDHIENGGLQCVYVDSLGAYNCANELHGCGYIDENGNQKLTWPVRAMRTYMKRLYTMLHAPGRDQAKNYLWAHMSARTSAPINAFVDFQCSGEELETELIGNSNYLEHYKMDAYQIYYLHSSGVVPMLLPNLGRTGPKEHRTNRAYNDQVLALVLLHDSLMWNLWCDMPYVNNLFKKLDTFGWQDPAMKFHSYRRQNFITTDTPDAFVSVYTVKNRAMAVIVNQKKSAQNVSLKVDYEALGLAADAVIRDVRTGKTVSAESLKDWKIEGYNFSLLQFGE